MDQDWEGLFEANVTEGDFTHLPNVFLPFSSLLSTCMDHIKGPHPMIAGFWLGLAIDKVESVSIMFICLFISLSPSQQGEADYLSLHPGPNDKYSFHLSLLTITHTYLLWPIIAPCLCKERVIF